MPAPFSRLQLAAALIEYDNDPENSNGRNKSAQESAIFAHFRRNPAARPDLHNRRSDHLGVNLPSDSGALDGRGSALSTRRSRGSRGSLDALRNPFGTDSMYEEDQDEEPEEDLEVDLSSWGLDQFIPKEKAKAKGKQKQSPAPTLAVVRSKTISGGPNEYGEIPAAIAQSSLNFRRQSTSSRLELTEDTMAEYTMHRRRAASQSNVLPTAVQDGGSIPFPSGRRSPGYDQIGSPRDGQFPPRSQSRASIGSRGLLNEPQEDDDPARQRKSSQGTLGTLGQTDNPFAIQAPTVTSRFDPKAAPVHERTISHGSVGSRGLLDNFDAVSTRTRDTVPRDRPYSVVELLRPKVLVMPSPLQQVEGPGDHNQTRDGFQLSKDGPPLPPGAKSVSRRLSSNLDSVPIPSNSFIPNPTADLSYAQRVFRNTLATGSSAGLVVDNMPPRATEDGEQVEFEPAAAVEVEDENAFYGDGRQKPARPAGKLYGKSLIDDLEQRKQEMRNKQRVFRGDQRPSMMARGESANTVNTANLPGTLIDPATLKNRPGANRQSSYGSQGSQNLLGRANSVGTKPLLSFDDDDKVQGLSPARPLNATRNKSVFGVDTLWEAEMAKLRKMQEEERIEQEERRKREEVEAGTRVEKDKKKLKKKRKGQDHTPPLDEQESRLAVQEVGAEPRISIEPPVLPDIKPTVHRTMPPPRDDDSDEGSDDDDGVAPPRAEVTAAWHSDSDDEGQRRTTGVGLRNPAQAKLIRPRGGDSDSEEDVPLTVAMQRATIRNTRSLGGDDSDEDEDKPLAQVLREPKIKSPVLDIDFDNIGSRSRAGGDESDDEQPLGLRASRAIVGDDDDKPLALHPEQQRRTQYQMFAAAQQQQAMMMQAQMTNSMYFNPQAMMSAPFFAPTPIMSPAMVNPMAMMQPPMPIPSPPPIQDEAKFMSVDRWRRDVAIDGGQ